MTAGFHCFRFSLFVQNFYAELLRCRSIAADIGLSELFEEFFAGVGGAAMSVEICKLSRQEMIEVIKIIKIIKVVGNPCIITGCP